VLTVLEVVTTTVEEDKVLVTLETVVWVEVVVVVELEGGVRK
jgi:hypothetical protein